MGCYVLQFVHRVGPCGLVRLSGTAAGTLASGAICPMQGRLMNPNVDGFAVVEIDFQAIT